MLRHLPLGLLTRMGLASVIKPRTRGWGAAREAIAEYVEEQQERRRRVLGLDKLVQAAREEL